MAVYFNPCKLRIVGMTNHTHNKYKTVMEMMLRHKDTFPWERLFSHRFCKVANNAIRLGFVIRCRMAFHCFRLFSNHKQVCQRFCAAATGWIQSE